MSRSVCAACGNAFSSSLAPTPTQTLELMDILRSNTVPLEVVSFETPLRSRGGVSAFSGGYLLIAVVPAELARYDAEIGRLQNERGALAEYADGCRSVLSSLRRVPTELWAVIFGMCSPYAPDGEYNLSDYTTPKEEVDHISQWHLLQLSQVSSLWHKIAMGTPKLWSKIVVDTAHWAKASLSPAKLLSLLSSSLKRSENHPLTLEIGVSQTDPEPHAVIDLLSRHAQRWKDVYFWSDSEPGPLLAAKGKLDCLENLYISADWKSVDIFQVAPRLAKVQFCGDVEVVPNLPWDQIRTFTYIATYSRPFTFLTLLGRCPNIRTFVFQLAFPDLPTGTTMASVASDVETLTFELDRVGNISRPQDTRTALVGVIFATLTLPSLQCLALRARRVNLGLPPIWDTDSFLSLADRFSFHGHLTHLEIDALITDQEFLRSVAVLPVLKKLFISDCTASDSHVVITDTLLQGLIRKGSGTTVVPKLEFLSLTSRLRFTDSIYRDLITSRLPVNIEDSFETHIWWLPDRRREFPLELLSRVLFQVGSRLSLTAFSYLSPMLNVHVDNGPPHYFSLRLLLQAGKERLEKKNEGLEYYMRLPESNVESPTASKTNPCRMHTTCYRRCTLLSGYAERNRSMRLPRVERAPSAYIAERLADAHPRATGGVYLSFDFRYLCGRLIGDHSEQSLHSELQLEGDKFLVNLRKFTFSNAVPRARTTNSKRQNREKYWVTATCACPESNGDRLLGLAAFGEANCSQLSQLSSYTQPPPRRYWPYRINYAPDSTNFKPRTKWSLVNMIEASLLVIAQMDLN
ncbi:hypothetical protein DFH06DRAFT_1396030 [Mycena polygramma]|nr:hypothetical protein DFH06DRAFT_1396030 [Mycena polygramma]